MAGTSIEAAPKVSSAPPPKPPRWDRAVAWLSAPYRRLAFGSAALGMVILGLASRYSPTDVHYLPACPIRGVTGYYCPGCGAARSLHALLQGDLTAAADWNVLFVALLPFFAIVAVLQFVSLVRDNQFRELAIPRWLLASVLIAMLTFAVARNLPYPWSRYLAP